jgi:RNA polymerase subunit RPABC4/transcription elongation factor Spt4
MEITCHRCHQPVSGESCYCPTCGLPQLVYTNAEIAANGQTERWTEAVRDASSIEWRPALRVATLIAIPAGLLSCGVSPVGILGMVWMATAAAWAVSSYVKRQQPAWITMGAGARIGFVTGLIGVWVAFLATGADLYARRYFFHQGAAFDQLWDELINQSINQQVQAMGSDPQALAAVKALALSPEGRAGLILAGMMFLELALLGFAVAGGAFGARMMARSRRPQA